MCREKESGKRENEVVFTVIVFEVGFSQKNPNISHGFIIYFLSGWV